MRRLIILVSLIGLSAGSGGRSDAAPIFFGPTPYLSAADIPAGFYAAGPTALENFEDGALSFGITASGDGVGGPGLWRDSVDADDGFIDGWGNTGWSWAETLTGQVTFTFPSLVTAAALVLTDAHPSAALSFEAFGPGMVSLGVLGPLSGIPDGSTMGQTAEDRFFGVQDPSGIMAIRMTTTIFSPGIDGTEVDHVQFGVAPVPEPTTGLLFVSGLGAIAFARRGWRSTR